MQKTQAEYDDGISSNSIPVELVLHDDGSIIISVKVLVNYVCWMMLALVRGWVIFLE